MGPLEQAKSELIRQFETLATTDQQSAIVRLQTKMKLGVDLLAWMKGQFVYPQFYLRFRDEDKIRRSGGESAVIFRCEFWHSNLFKSIDFLWWAVYSSKVKVSLFCLKFLIEQQMVRQ